MSTYPDAPVYEALKAAAIKYEMPITLLMGVAFVESRFNPTAVGPKTSKGWQAQGLMQLSPQIIARYDVTDPLDPVQSAAAGAALLKALAKPLAWNIDRMLASYNWGVANVANATNTGAAWPKQVYVYVQHVKDARLFYEDQAQPAGRALLEQMNNAITGLAAINPMWGPAGIVANNWRAWYSLHKEDNVAEIANQLPVLEDLWKQYDKAFDRAPLTDEHTPLPDKIQPNATAAAAANAIVDAAKKKAGQVIKVVEDLPAELGTAAQFGGYVLVGALLLYAAAAGRRR